MYIRINWIFFANWYFICYTTYVFLILLIFLIIYGTSLKFENKPEIFYLALSKPSKHSYSYFQSYVLQPFKMLFAYFLSKDFSSVHHQNLLIL
jgi:hypothetical protein